MDSEKETLPDDVLLNILRSRSAGFNNGPVTISNKIIDYPIELDRRDPSTYHLAQSHLHFDRCHFIGGVVSVGYPQISGEITFSDCIFEYGATFNDPSQVTFSGLNEFKDDVRIWHRQNLRLDKVNFYKNLYLGSSYETVDLQLTQFNEGRIEENSTLIIEGEYRLIDINLASINILQIVATCKRISVTGSNCSLITVKSNDIKESISFWFSKFSRVELSSIGRPRIPNIDISKCGIQEIEFPIGQFARGIIQDCKIASVSISGVSEKDNSLSVVKCGINLIKFVPFTANNGIISFQDVKVLSGGMLSIIRSDLGKTNFILCEFQAGTMEFESSKMTEIFVADTDFPAKVYVNEKINHSQARLAFGQLSTAFQKQGDTVRALDYQSREIASHYYQLSFFQGRTFNFTKLSLWLNKWSNDFGRNWARGIAFSFISGIIFYILLLFSTKNLYFDINGRFDYRIFSSFLKFMNPLRFFETENLFKLGTDPSYASLTPVSYLIDFLSRIIVAYGFYQTIQAFRRFGRK